jgi:DNA-binding NarL/FixJ family response regulator
MSIQVLVIESHPPTRAGLRALFGFLRGVQIVGEIDDIEQAPAQVATLKPHVVLMGINHPGGPAVEMVRQLCAKFPDVKVILLALDTHAAYVEQAITAGAAGYLSKTLADELETGLRAATGKVLLDQSSRTLDSRNASLSPRQRQVLTMIGEGFTTKEIAANLGISFKTAQTHRTELMQRLDIHNVATLVRHAIRTGLVPPG